MLFTYNEWVHVIFNKQTTINIQRECYIILINNEYNNNEKYFQ